MQEGKEVERIVGSNPPEFTKKIIALSEDLQTAPSTDPKALLYERIQKLIDSSKVMAFIKGTKAEPQCGFTRNVLEILNKTNVEYNTFNILSSPEVRQGLKEMSKWPTYPQLYVNGKLVGGHDIIKELDEEGELVDVLTE